MTNAALWLRRFLVLNGSVLLLACGAVVMPHAWMDVIHQRTGLGPLPEMPIVGYLTRSLSALYALHGVMTLIIAADVPRYLPLIRFSGMAAIAFGLTLAAINLTVHMPLRWTLGEGFFVPTMGVLILWLAGRCQATPPCPGG